MTLISSLYVILSVSEGSLPRRELRLLLRSE